MASSSPSSSRPTVTIRQGTLQGTIIDAVARPIEGFLGVPYALPPTGDRRFRPPVAVATSSAVIDASKFGPAAPGKQLRPGSNLLYSEDCLTANIFRHVPTSETATKLPVAVYIHGGAFNRGTSSSHNTASFLAYSAEPFIVVSFNYRLGALGFLPSALSAKEGALNLGLRDQILLLEWVQENIAAFGGDPNNVAIFGISAGGHSVGHHLFNYKDGVAPLFHRALLESGATTSRAVRPYDAPVHEAQFSDLLKEVGVPESLPEDQIFSFLRKVPEDVITAAQTAVFDKYNPSLRWAFQPVIDGDIIPRAPLQSWMLGRWHKMRIMTGFNGNEGSLYVNKKIDEPEQFVRFFHELLPLLTDADLEAIDRLYPDPTKFPESVYTETREGYGLGSQYKRIEAAYGHYAYVAPVRQTAELASAGQEPPVFLYHWALISTVLNGAQHADNLNYECRDPVVVDKSPVQAEVAGHMHAYITSFLLHGCPNKVRGEFADRPKWEAYTPAKPKTLIFGLGNEELIGGPVGTPSQCIEDTWARKESEFWWSKVDVSQQ